MHAYEHVRKSEWEKRGGGGEDWVGGLGLASMCTVLCTVSVTRDGRGLWERGEDGWRVCNTRAGVSVVFVCAQEDSVRA